MATFEAVNARSPSRTAWVLSTMVLVVVCDALHADDPLTLIPADAAMVVSFRNLADGRAKLDDFIRSYDKSFQGVDVDEVQRGFNLPDGVLDTSAPAFLILTKPRRIRSSFVLAFRPKDLEAFRERVEGQDNAVRECEGPEGCYYLMMRGETAFVAHRSKGAKKAINKMRRVKPRASLAAALDIEQKKLFASNDVIIHLPLAKWRDRIQPFVFLMSNMIRLSVTATQSDRQMVESSLTVINWFTEGFEAVIAQMRTVTLGLQFDGETFRLTHHHTFERGGSVSKYLSQVRRPGCEGLSRLPDRPFLALGMTDWRCPADMSVSVRLNRYILGNEAVSGRLSPQKRRRFRNAATKGYGQMRGTAFMLAGSEGRLLPFQAYGVYTMDDAEEGIRHLISIDECAGEVFSAFTSGMFGGSFKKRTRKGRQFYEMELDADHMEPRVRQQMNAIYGERFRFQQAVANKHNVVFCTAQPPASVHEMLDMRSGTPSIADNPLVRRIVGHLPSEKANAILVLDLGRCLNMLGGLRAGVSGFAQPSAYKHLVDVEYSAPPGPLLGWAGYTGTTSFTGQWAMDADDLVRLAGEVKNIAN